MTEDQAVKTEHVRTVGDQASEVADPLAPTTDSRVGRTRRFASRTITGIGWVPTTAVLIVVGCRVLTVLLVAIVNRFAMAKVTDSLTIWDGSWFLRIVHHGYPSRLPMVADHVAANPIAFFPVFPLTVRGLASIGFDPGVMALVVSAVTGVCAVVAVGRLARHMRGDAAGERAAVLFALCPGAFAFSFAYAEGIVITLVALGLIALLDQRWLVAGLLGALATATSPVGLAFVVACAAASAVDIAHHRRLQSVVAPVFAPLGFIAYMAYLWAHTGSLFAWRLTERGGWQSFPSLRYPAHIIWTFVSDPLRPTLTGHILFAGTVAGIIGCVLMIRERQALPVLVYGIATVALAAISQPVGLRPRFLMLAFPIVIALATRYSGRTYRVLVAASAVLLALLSVYEISSRAVFP
jgi:hypothetical protein